FFQAEDGIRDRNVTGVQTCALPISTTKKARISFLERSIVSKGEILTLLRCKKSQLRLAGHCCFGVLGFSSTYTKNSNDGLYALYMRGHCVKKIIFSN